MNFFFRMPKFPILLDTGTELIALHTAAECEVRLPALPLAGEGPRPVIDATAEGFAFYPHLETITPLTMKKNWTKAEIISLYNARRHPGAPAYAPSLSARRLTAVVADVVRLSSEGRTG